MEYDVSNQRGAVGYSVLSDMELDFEERIERWAFDNFERLKGTTVRERTTMFWKEVMGV